MHHYNIVAMIPARLGSKRIPLKNIRYIGDKPLIQYPIDLCINSGLFDDVWVNTENKELGKIAGTMGAVFHERPENLAGENATNRDFVYEFLKNHECDYVVMVNTTSPLLRQDTMNGFLNFIQNNDFDTVLSVVSEKEETFFMDKPLNFKLEEKVNSQLLPATEKIVWAMTAWKRESFIHLQENNINPVFGGKLGKFQIPKDEACDLDTEEDWRIAEGILLSREIKKEARFLSI